MINGKHNPLPGEIIMKEWLYRKAKELNTSPRAIAVRLSRGTLAYPEVRRLNERVVFVKI